MTSLSTGYLWDGLVAGKKKDFLVLPDARFSYADLEQAVRRWLATFDGAGIGENDRIIIQSANQFATISCFIACLVDGVTPVMVTADTPPLRALSLAETVEAAGFIADADRMPDRLPSATASISLGKPEKAKSGLFSRGKTDWLPGISPDPATREPRLPADPDGLAFLLFTSGTTSSPSGVQLTRKNLFANLQTISRIFDYDGHSRIFNDMNLGHTDGLTQGPALALANRACLIRAGGFQIGHLEPWLETVRKERATHFITVPTIWAMIDKYAGHDDYFDAPEFKSLQSVAAKFPEELWGRLEARFDLPIANHYGLTETVASALYAGPHPEMGAFGTVGLPIDCEARIAPGSTDPKEGELQLRGDNIFPGYWRNPERTAQTFTDDGWMKSGDLARLLDDGSYQILGRIKTVIMMGIIHIIILACAASIVVGLRRCWRCISTPSSTGSTKYGSGEERSVHQRANGM